MQTIVDAIRGAGAHQPIMLGGLSYANDLSGWLSHEPTDPDGQLAASFHNYEGQACSSPACWDAQVAPVAAQVPVVGGEFDQNVCAPSTFDVDYMNWADLHGVSYLAWGWWVLSPAEIADAGCSAYYLISDPSGTPAAPNGVNLHDHLAALTTGGSGTTPTTTTPPPPPATNTTPAPTTPSRAARLQRAPEGRRQRGELRPARVAEQLGRDQRPDGERVRGRQEAQAARDARRGQLQADRGQAEDRRAQAHDIVARAVTAAAHAQDADHGHAHQHRQPCKKCMRPTP